MTEVTVPAPIRELLAANLLEERDILESIGLAGIEESADCPGRATCSCMVPVRRAFDPETAEMRRLRVALVSGESGGWRIESIAGLTLPGE